MELVKKEKTLIIVKHIIIVMSVLLVKTNTF